MRGMPPRTLVSVRLDGVEKQTCQCCCDSLLAPPSTPVIKLHCLFTDRVVTAEETTVDLYQDIAKPLVVSTVEGYNGLLSQLS